MAEGEWPSTGGGAVERRGRRYRRLGIGASVLAFLLLVGIIHVSTFRVRHGTRVFSQQPWIAGQRVALRVVVLDLASVTYLQGVQIRAKLLPEEGGRETALGEGTLEATRSLELSPLLPKTLGAGRYLLNLELTVPGEAPEIVQMPVTVETGRTAAADHAGAWLRLRNVCEEGRTREVGGGWAPSSRCKRPEPTRLYPESGTLVGNLENEVFLWSEPEGPEVAFRLRPAPPAPGLPALPTNVAFETIPRDALGVGILRLRPGYPRKRLEIRVGAAPPRRVWLRDLPTQLLIRLEHGMQRADETFGAQVFSMRRDVPLFLDLWLEGRWIGADSVMLDGSEGLRYEVALPPEAAGLAVLRVSTSADGEGGTADLRAVFIDSRAETAQGLRRLIARLRDLPTASGPTDPGPRAAFDEIIAREPAPEALLALPPRAFALVDRAGLSRVAALLLSRVEGVSSGAPVLGDDTRRKRRKLESTKRNLRRPLLAGLVVLTGLVFSVVFVTVRRSRREMRSMLLDLDLEAEAGDTDEPVAAILSGGVGFSLALMLLLFVCTLVGLVALFETLRWDWGM